MRDSSGNYKSKWRRYKRNLRWKSTRRKTAGVVQSDYQGWTNWETWNTMLMLDNEYETYQASRNLMERGATEQQIEQFVIQNVIGPYNQERIKEAQEWNAIDPDERRRMTDERNREQYGDFAVNFGNNVFDTLGMSNDPGAFESAEDDLIDPSKVNFNEIYETMYQELIDNGLVEPQTTGMDQPGDTYPPEGWQ